MRSVAVSWASPAISAWVVPFDPRHPALRRHYPPSSRIMTGAGHRRWAGLLADRGPQRRRVAGAAARAAAAATLAVGLAASVILRRRATARFFKMTVAPALFIIIALG